MKVAIDTNIVIALEPTSEDYVEATTASAAMLVQLASRAGVELFIHPAQSQDFNNDPDERRRSLRQVLTGKYQLLDPAPPVNERLEQVLGMAAPGTHDYVDHLLLAAVEAPAVDYLVTEDKQILRKATRIGVRDRVLLLLEAIDVFGALSDRASATPPAVRAVKAYELDRQDPIWTSFGPDYAGFQGWLEKCAREHRDAWVIDGEAGYATVVIVNRERRDIPGGLQGKVLKICSFKASERYHGLRYGELMLKTIFRFTHVNRYDWVFIESFPKQEALLRLLETFGFQQVDQKANGELVLAKPMRPNLADDKLAGLEFHRRFGPYFIDWQQPAFIVPIQPRFEELLFPEQQEQGSLLAGEHAFGNAIRKAYLCHAPTQKVQSGAILLFYRSEDKQALTTIGVVEDTLRSADSDNVAAYVARRTVYSMKDIRAMASKPILAIRFRHARLIEPHIRLQDLMANGILVAAPMSIVSVPEKGKAWLQTRVDQ